jgi:TolA-binding protein
MSSCRTVRPWLHRDSASIDEADRLVLEEHVQGCSDCLRDRDSLLGVRALVHVLPTRPLRANEVQRVIAKALLDTREQEPAREPFVAGRSRWAVLGFAVAMIAVLVVWIATRIDEPAVVAMDTGPRVIDTPTEHVEIAAASVYRWTPDVLWLDEGTAAIDARRTTPLRITTPRFSVDATRAEYRVTTTNVTVTRGTVRVFGSYGEMIVPALHAGETWTLPYIAAGASGAGPSNLSAAGASASGDGSSNANAAGTGPGASGDGSSDVNAAAGTGDSTSSGDAGADSRDPSAAAMHLSRARKAFARSECKAVRTQATAALATDATRAQAAEAHTLLAECAQLEGRLDEAAASYDSIATRFAGLPAGETALIALARLEHNRGNTSAARGAYQRYLKRYPEGRFADDARRYLSP